MKVTVTARHARFSGRMKAYARDKAQHLEHYFDHLRKLEVILDAGSGNRIGAEMIASAVRGHILVCHSTGATAMAAVDSVMNKMERQLIKFKERLQERHSHHAGARPGKFNGGRPRPAAGEGP
ncbi:MAG TPA: ribosome-associated translation inhibitor RaiA [Planctomycetota bacterium]|nr:ribosome-associated translation inhibitor RaiA [Planctomycetota bacterium]